MTPSDYFLKPQSAAQRQYCALAAYYKDGLAAAEAAKIYGYTLSAFYSLIREFSKRMKENRQEDPFFKAKTPGRKKRENKQELIQKIIALRNRDMSNAQIQRALQGMNMSVSLAEIWRILNRRGYAKMKRRNAKTIEKTDDAINNNEHLPHNAENHKPYRSLLA